MTRRAVDADGADVRGDRHVPEIRPTVPISRPDPANVRRPPLSRQTPAGFLPEGRRVTGDLGRLRVTGVTAR